MAKFWVSPHRHKLGLWPRGYFKSTLFSIIGPLWNIVRNLSDEPISPPVIPFQYLMASERSENSEKFLNAIKDHVTLNRRFRFLFPEIRPSTPWNHKVRNLKRDFDPTLKEFTFESAGLNSDPTSTHFTDIIGDDLTGLTNYGSEDGRDSVESWWTATNPLLLPTGRRMLVMTRWHFDDIAGRIIRKNPTLPESERYYIEAHSCYDELGQSTFPTVWPDDKLAAERIHQTSERFSCWMENNPETPESHFFDASRIEYWNKTADFDKLLATMQKVLIVDPATGITQMGDPSGIVIVAYKGDDRYVLRTEAQQWSWLELVQEVKTMCRTHNVNRLGIEAAGQGSAIMTFFEAEYRKGGMPFPERLHPQHKAKGNKEERVKGLIPYVHRGQIKFHRSQEDLLSQVKEYPHVRRDDLVDALSYLPVMVPFLGDGSVRKGSSDAPSDTHPASRVLAREPDDAIYQPSQQQWGWS